MKLVIVESPSKSKTISKYLGDDFIVRASVGHVRDLPKSQKKAVDIEGGFVPHYEIVAKKGPVLDEIAHEAEKADQVILATDPDREGEAIAWHIAEVLKERLGPGVAKKMERITFQEITKEAVQDAIRHPRQIDERLREAQEARRVLDRLVGYDLSGLIWKKVRYGLSAGRVQSPALRIIMEREREIRAFVPETYWSITADYKAAASGAAKGAAFQLTCAKEPRDRTEVDTILDTARSPKAGWTVTDVEETEVKRSPRAPFITSTLQQAASTRLGFSPSRTMGIAQKLYEAGHITYMRTDSTNLGAQAVEQISAVITKSYGDQYLNVQRYATKSKNAQEAHEAIRPSVFAKASAGATDEQKKLYRLIWQRAVASQMSDAIMARTKISANVAGATGEGSDAQPIPAFETTGSRVIFDGWLKADPESVGEDIVLPKVKKGEALTLTDIRADEKQTQPPSRYTEAGLIKELEKRGIGRPSTYASICKTIEDRGYVERENRSLKPTDTGDVVSTFLEEYFPSYISDSFTADMENQLDEIASGDRTYVKTLSDFYGPFLKDVKSKEKISKATKLGAADPKFKCPKCGASPMEIKLGRNGKFLSCSRYPDCDGALTIDGLEFKKDEPIGTDPATGLPIFVLNGRFGPYVQLGTKPEKATKVKKPRRKKGEASSAESAVSGDPTETAAASSAKPRMASIPKGKDPTTVTVADALVYLSLPRVLGTDPATGVKITASIGRFGPYIVRDKDFRSVKAPDDVYKITLERALEILSQPKAKRGFQKKKIA
ncbi:MAG TPA: type I DNA topoisomerase [Candidatus Paceibacterota bacterium]